MLHELSDVHERCTQLNEFSFFEMVHLLARTPRSKRSKRKLGGEERVVEL